MREPKLLSSEACELRSSAKTIIIIIIINNSNICQPPYSLISIKETKLEDILQVLSKAALN